MLQHDCFSYGFESGNDCFIWVNHVFSSHGFYSGNGGLWFFLICSLTFWYYHTYILYSINTFQSMSIFLVENELAWFSMLIQAIGFKDTQFLDPPNPPVSSSTAGKTLLENLPQLLRWSSLFNDVQWLRDFMWFPHCEPCLIPGEHVFWSWEWMRGRPGCNWEHST